MQKKRKRYEEKLEHLKREMFEKSPKKHKTNALLDFNTKNTTNQSTTNNNKPNNTLLKNKPIPPPELGEEDLAEFALEDFEDSDSETPNDSKTSSSSNNRAGANDNNNYTFYHSSSDEENNNNRVDNESGMERIKVYYASRTHSQLLQFVNEVKKTGFANSTKVITLGSRQNLCINEDVLKLKSNSRINEKCLDMQENSSNKKKKSKSVKEKEINNKTSSTCPYFNITLQRHFGDLILVKLQDIEEYFDLGKKLSTCAYYGSRSAIQFAELICLPYNSILHKSTREALGISLKGNVVIFDEAHNIVDAINNMYSVTLTAKQVSIHF